MEKGKNKALKALLIYIFVCLTIIYILPAIILNILGWQKFD